MIDTSIKKKLIIEIPGYILRLMIMYCSNRVSVWLIGIEVHRNHVNWLGERLQRRFFGTKASRSQFKNLLEKNTHVANKIEDCGRGKNRVPKAAPKTLRSKNPLVHFRINVPSYFHYRALWFLLQYFSNLSKHLRRKCQHEKVL